VGVHRSERIARSRLDKFIALLDVKESHSRHMEVDKSRNDRTPTMKLGPVIVYFEEASK
jgi:hypothetical protein